MKAVECIATSNGENARLFEEVTRGPISPQTILLRLYDDLGDSYIRDGLFYYLHTVTGLLWPRSPFRPETALERKVFGRLLAAYRRQFCIGDRGPPWQGMISKGFSTYISCALSHYVCVCVLLIMNNSSVAVRYCHFTSARMFESQLYGTIFGVIAQWLSSQTIETSSAWRLLCRIAESSSAHISPRKPS